MTTKKSSKKSIQEIITGKPPAEQQPEPTQSDEPVIDTVSGLPEQQTQPPVKKKRAVSEKRLQSLEKSRTVRIENDKVRKQIFERVSKLKDKHQLTLSDIENELDRDDSSDDEEPQVPRQRRVQFERHQIDW